MISIIFINALLDGAFCVFQRETIIFGANFELLSSQHLEKLFDDYIQSINEYIDNLYVYMFRDIYTSHFKSNVEIITIIINIIFNCTTDQSLLN